MQSNLRISRTLSAVATVLIATGVLASIALAAPEQTRESYAAAVEPICKTSATTSERTLSGVHKEIKEGKLKLAASQFAKAAAASTTATKRIKAVPQPAADKAVLTEWIGYLEDERKLLVEIGKALKEGKKSKAVSLSVRLTSNGNLANNTVLNFEFKYCLIETSKFS